MTDRLSSPALRILGTRSGLSELAAIDTTILKNGATVYVTQQNALYTLAKESTDTANGIDVVAPVQSAGRWFRESTTNPAYGSQTAWFLDPVNGNDSNDGLTAATAIRTRRQLADRLRYPQFITGKPVVVNVLEDVPSGDPFDLDLSLYPADGSSGSFSIIGAKTELFTGVLTGWTPEAQATNQRASITIAGIDWSTAGPGGSSLIGMRVRKPSNDSFAWLYEQDVAPDTCFVNQPMRRATFGDVNWSIGDTVVVERLTSFGDAYTLNSRMRGSFATALKVEDLLINDPSGTVYLGGFAQSVVGCEFNVSRLVVDCASLLLGNKYDVGTFSGTSWEHNFNGGLIVGVSAWEGSATMLFNESVTATGSQTFRNGNQTIFSTGSTAGLGVWGWSGAAVSLDRGVIMSLGGRLWGVSTVANSYGLSMQDSTIFSYSAVPSIDGAHATQDFVLAGNPFMWASAPQIDAATLARVVARA